MCEDQGGEPKESCWTGWTTQQCTQTCPDQLSGVLTKIFNLSRSRATVPSYLK